MTVSSLKMKSNNLRLSIGLCAWNEAATIEGALLSILAQDIFRDETGLIESIEVVCLANACTDKTAEIAREVLSRESKSITKWPALTWRVEDVPWGGLARALNVLTHELSDSSADYMFKMDCDVLIEEPNALRELISALLRDPIAQVAVPVSLKHIAKTSKKSPIDTFSMAASDTFKPENIPLSGALYCGRKLALRSVWQVEGPRGSDVGTDVHVRDMLVTDQWRSRAKWREDLVIRVPTATVYFLTYTKVLDMLYHQKRLAIAEVNRMMLHSYLSENVKPDGASELIRHNNAQNPDWFREVVDARLKKGQWWVLPRTMFQWNRLRSLKRLNGLNRLLRLPIALTGEVIDLYAVLAANHAFKKRVEGAVWRRDR